MLYLHIFQYLPINVLFSSLYPPQYNLKQNLYDFNSHIGDVT
jgi:hypothetical protein